MNEDKKHSRINADFSGENLGVIPGKIFIFPAICVHSFFHPRSSAVKGFCFYG